MKRVHIVLCALLIAAAAIATAACFADLPASVPIHWNTDGRPKGMGPRAMLWLLGPGTMAGILLLGLCLPSLSPERYRIEPFKATYSYFILVLVGMLACLHLALLRAILTGAIDIARTACGGLFLLLILLGNPLGKVRRNFFIGVRTPWSLASEQVWYATHRLAARLMVGSGLLGLVAVTAGAPSWALVALGGGWALIAVVFSLVHYKRLQRGGQLRAG
jgi:uncharacterized membrane protein